MKRNVIVVLILHFLLFSNTHTSASSPGTTSFEYKLEYLSLPNHMYVNESEVIELFFITFLIRTDNASSTDDRHPKTDYWMIRKGQETFLNVSIASKHYSGYEIRDRPDSFIEFYMLENNIPNLIRNVTLYLNTGTSTTIYQPDGGKITSNVTVKSDDSAGSSSRTTIAHQTYSFDNLFFRFYIYDYYGSVPFNIFIMIPTLIVVALIYRHKRK